MHITPEQFEQQRKPRFGRTNPERMQLAHWEWLVRDGGGPLRDLHGIQVKRGNGPDWSFDRFGMSRTPMPDGRTICIAGEHEDFYDPDFNIYNDVIVLRAAPGQPCVTPSSGEVEIYGYPESVFTPTDFHSATLVGNKILVIGSLGYMGTRRPGHTPICSLDTATYAIAACTAGGPCPGWIHGHHASYDASSHSITVRGGRVQLEDPGKLLRNHAAHRLHLDNLHWELIATHEPHQRFLIHAFRTVDDFQPPEPESLRPRSVAHTWLLPEHRLTPRVDIQGVRIEFKCSYREIDVLVEGDLPRELIDALLQDVLSNLNARGDSTWEVRATDPGPDQSSSRAEV